MSSKFFLEMTKGPHPIKMDDKINLYFKMLNLAYAESCKGDKAQYEANAMKNWKVVKEYNLDCRLNSFWKLVQVSFERVGKTHKALVAFKDECALGSWGMEFIQITRERKYYPAYVNITHLGTGLNKINDEYKMCYEIENLSYFWGYEMVTQSQVEDYLAIMKYVNNLKAEEVE